VLFVEQQEEDKEDPFLFCEPFTTIIE
jgi:hypothetical protein